MRILIVAPNISMKMGGEAVLPFHLIRELRALGHEPIAYTHARVRDELKASDIWADNSFYFAEDSFWEKSLHNVSQFIPQAIRNVIAYFGISAITQYRLAKRARVLATELDVDIIHQPTPVSPQFPSFLTNMPAPTIIGPLNGGMNFPDAFVGDYSRGSQGINKVVRLFSGIANKLVPGKRQATRILAANSRTRDALPSVVDRKKTGLLVENGVDLATWDGPSVEQHSTPTFVFVGRLVWLKAVELLIEAFSQLKAPARLVIVGDGEERSKLEALSAQLSNENLAIEFVGFKPQKEIGALLRTSRALVLPSLKECGGAVILEAFACSTTAIATAWGGPLDYINDKNGILVEPNTRSQFIAGLQAAMQDLIDHPGKAAALGTQGRKDVEDHYDWAQKAKSMVAIYEDVSVSN